LTLGALAVLAAYGALPRGGQLTHMDFLADNATVLELCNPLNTGPLPVAAGRDPVVMDIVSRDGGEAGAAISGRFDLTSISGKPVAPEDLQPVDGQRIRLTVESERGQVLPFAIRNGWQKVKPDPFRPGRWSFSFVPSIPGPYHLVADFTPVATGKPLRASAVLSPVR
jgi:hypothetical protein